MSSLRHLVLVLGDQLDLGSAAFDGFDPKLDAVWMAEVAGESENVWSTQIRTTLFLAAMRHFRARARKAGWRVEYTEMDDAENRHTLAGELERAGRRLRPQRLIVVRPGEWRVQEALRSAATTLGLELEIRPDRHFLASPEEFAAHAKGRRQLRMEFFYREMRRRHGILVLPSGEPEGGEWNFDHENRESFGRNAPSPPAPRAFPPDRLTREVIALVRKRFADRPGDLDRFDWPVTPEDAEAALADFVEHRLRDFGRHQDAMWVGQPWLYHSRLAAAMNLKLLDPRRVIAAAVAAYRDGRAPLPAVEGFIRQILGWREFVNGVYWLRGPEYLSLNALNATRPLPAWFWTGETPLNCLAQCLRQVLDTGYNHHIQRLMVLGNFLLLTGIRPAEALRWFNELYIDAHDWVMAANVIGMALHADGGFMATKPYAAGGAYLSRMSDYCRDCRFRPDVKTGPEACPLTFLYWDFIARHGERFGRNPRMATIVQSWKKRPAGDQDAVRSQAAAFLEREVPTT